MSKMWFNLSPAQIIIQAGTGALLHNMIKAENIGNKASSPHKRTQIVRSCNWINHLIHTYVHIYIYIDTHICRSRNAVPTDSIHTTRLPLVITQTPKGFLTCGKCNWSPSLGMGWRDGVWSSCMLNRDARADWAARAFASFLFLPEPSKVCPSTATAMTKFLAWLSPLSERNSYFSPGRSSLRIMTGFFPLAVG